MNQSFIECNTFFSKLIIPWICRQSNLSRSTGYMMQSKNLIVQWTLKLKRKIRKITIGKKTWGYKVIAYIINNTRRIEEKKIKSKVSEGCKFICLLSHNWYWYLSWDAMSISLLFVVETRFPFVNPPMCLVNKNSQILQSPT